MSENQLNTAKQLLQEKRYDEALELLKTINHPTARQWLKKLEEMNASSESPNPKKNMKSQVPLSTVVTSIFIVCLVLAVIIQQVQIYRINQELLSLDTEINIHADIITGLDADLQELNNVVSSNTNDITSLDSDVLELVDVVNSHTNYITNLDSDVLEIINVVNSHADDINDLASDLSIVADIAANADNYAHSHNNFSDASLKIDILNVENALDNIMLLHSVSFTWDNTDYPNLHLAGRDFGLIAQELQVIFPELVTTDPSTGLLQVDYEGLIPILIAAIQEQQAQIEALQAN